MPMQIEILPDAAAVASRAAAIIAEHARAAVLARGRFLIAVSGGHTPWVMLRELAKEDVPWHGVHVFQVDERIAPAGDPDIDEPPVGEAAMGQERVERHDWFLAAV